MQKFYSNSKKKKRKKTARRGSLDHFHSFAGSPRRHLVSPAAAAKEAMLTGRESLVRLIGRRRRSPLPAALALAVPPSRSLQVWSNLARRGELTHPRHRRFHRSHRFCSGSFCVLQDDAADAEREAAAGGSSSGGGDAAGAAGWVACPVCGESIRGTDYCVNTHLGSYSNP